MFIKLLKWDIRNQKVIGYTMLITILATLICAILKLVNNGTVWTSGLFLAGVIILGGYFVTTLYPAYYLAKSLYGSQSYIQHSIALDSVSIWHSKIISGMLFNALALVLLVLEAFFLAYVYTEGQIAFFIRVLLSEGLVRMSQMIGIPVAMIWLIIIAFMIIGLVSMQVMYGFVVVFGNHRTLQKQGLIRYFISYVAYYVIVQVSSLVGMIIMPVTLVINRGVTGLNPTVQIKMQSLFGVIASSNENILPIGSVILGILMTIGFYWYSRNLLSKHLNLL